MGGAEGARRRRASALAVGLAVALFSGGCKSAAQTRAEQAAVEVREVFAAFRSEGGELRLILDVENREAQAGTLSRVSWELWLRGRYFAAGEQVASGALPLGGRATVELRAPLSYQEVRVASEPTALEVAVRGGVTASFGGVLQRLPFQVRRRIVAQGAVLFGGEE
ncbi:MAG: LEA type 2 family protein [Myxococcales bacterium]|nr:LEA type 2 family protein [Myxococcales bacterium]